jgi:hypothetical protein
MRFLMKKAAVSSILIAGVLLALGVIAEAQQSKKIPKIGYLSAVDPATESARAETIRLALGELGYMEDRPSPSSTDMGRRSPLGLQRSPPSWCVSRLISS